MYRLASHLDDFGTAAWVGLALLGFLLWWPLGLVVLGFLIGSGRIMCWTAGTGTRWQRRFERMQRHMERMQGAAERWGCGTRASAREATGNRAFDDYRAETLRRLEEEQREFVDFLDRLRRARDKAEFDQFMAERRRPAGSAPQPQEI
jgi:hypothetical protein